MDCATCWYVLVRAVFLFSWAAFLLMGLVLLNKTLEPRAQVNSKFVTGLLKLFCVVFPLSVSTNMDVLGLLWVTGVAHPHHLLRIQFLKKLLCFCQLLHAFPAAWLIHPCHLLFILCFGGLFCLDITSLLVCWALAPTTGTQQESLSWSHLPAGGRCRGAWARSGRKALRGCTKLTVGCLGKVPKVGKGRG